MACKDCDENSSTLPNGPSGNDGAAGLAGTNGQNFIPGSGVPSGSTGNNGDTYLDVSTYTIYAKTGGTWYVIGNIKGANGTGLIKFSQSALSPVTIAGTVTQTILYSLINTYGLIATSSPGVVAPPVGFEYGTEKTDFVISVYEYIPGTSSWQKIIDSRNNVSTNSTGDITIITSGFSGIPNKLRYIIIG